MSPEDSYVNRGPRAAKQRELIQYEKYLVENGLTAEQARQVTQEEWDALERSADPIPSGQIDEVAPQNEEEKRQRQ